MASLEIDWTKDGRQSAYIHLPSSVNTSAWQNIRIPVYLLKNGAGPVTLLLGGNHGDEYEGQVALSKLAHHLKPEEIRGTIVIIPSLNLPAVMSGQRLSPIDDRNLNREFPGDARGSVTQRLAHFVSTQLVPRCDNVIDLHSGGRTLNFVPCTFIHAQENEAENQRFIDAALAFGAPLTVIIREPHADVMLDDVVEKSGKLMLSSELGGSACISVETMTLTYDGILSTLHHLNQFQIVTGRNVVKQPTQRLVTVPDAGYYIHADDTGLYEPVVPLGTDLQAGDIIGFIHHIDRNDKAPSPVKAPKDGLLFCVAGQGLVRRDDTIVVIAADHQ